MTPDQLQILKNKLEQDFVPTLPPLIDQSKPVEHMRAKNRSRAYSAFAIQKLTRVDNDTAGASVVDDYDDNGIDAIFYHQASKKLFIVQSKLKADEHFKLVEMTPFLKGINDLINQHYDRFNQHVVSRAAELDSALDDADEIIIVIAHSAPEISLRAKNALNEYLSDTDQEEDRLSADWVDFGPKQTVEELLDEKAANVVDDQLFLHEHKRIDAPRVTYYGQVSVKELASLYTNHGNALLEQNIRYFLGVRLSSVNRGIHKSLHEKPEDFFYLNNGVTALAHKVEIKGRRRDGGGRKFIVKGLSVINGAQTIASSESFIREFPDADISSARVMLTLIQVDPDDTFGALVTKARNHQNPVTATQFAALDPTQERLRRELAHLAVVYKYRPEARIRMRLQEVMSISEAAYALALFTPDPNFPIALKKEPSKFLIHTADEYRKVFRDELSGIKLANAVRLYRAADRVISSSENASSGQEKLIYRHGRYAILWLALHSNHSWLNRGDVMSDSDARTLLTHPLDEWREKVRSAVELDLATSYRGPLAFFRNTTTARPFILAMKREGI